MKEPINMSEKRLTAIEIIDETVEYYSADPKGRRSLVDATDKECLYNGPNNTHCAFGRCMLSEYKEQGDALPGNNNSIDNLCVFNKKTHHDHLLAPKYRGQPLVFWSRLQSLHDEDHFWNEKGLSQAGQRYVDDLKESY